MRSWYMANSHVCCWIELIYVQWRAKHFIAITKANRTYLMTELFSILPRSSSFHIVLRSLLLAFLPFLSFIIINIQVLFFGLLMCSNMKTKQFNDLFWKMYIFFIIKVVVVVVFSLVFFSSLLRIQCSFSTFIHFSNAMNVQCVSLWSSDSVCSFFSCVCVCVFTRRSPSLSCSLTVFFSSRCNLLVSHYLKFYAKLLRKYHCYCEDTLEILCSNTMLLSAHSVLMPLSTKRMKECLCSENEREREKKRARVNGRHCSHLANVCPFDALFRCIPLAKWCSV